MTQLTLADRLAEVLESLRRDWSPDGMEKRHDGDWLDYDAARPAVLTLIRTLLREERARCAEVALRRVASDSPDHVAADCTECHDGLMLARDIRALEDRP